jgi:hypothetical protein
VSFGRNRESRSREAAGRRNWPEAVPRKMRGRKEGKYCVNAIGQGEIRAKPNCVLGNP